MTKLQNNQTVRRALFFLCNCPRHEYYFKHDTLVEIFSK